MVAAVPAILARPPAPPAPVESAWQGIVVEWIGWDGSTWVLSDFRSGLLLYGAGVRGLHFPKVEKHKSRSRAVPGYRLRGWQTTQRTVFWPIFVYADGSEAWRELQDSFFRTVHPEKTGRWRVRVGDQVRELHLTGVFDDDHEDDHDPYEAGWALYGVTLEPSQPYWRPEEPVEVGPFRASEGEPFIPETLGPPFHISSAGTLTSAAIENPGDIDGWVEWQLDGPWNSGMELGVGGVNFTVPFAVPDGETLLIYSDPRADTTALMDGVDKTEQLGLVDFGPVPAAGETQLHIDGVGEGSVTARLWPGYFRAF